MSNIFRISKNPRRYLDQLKETLRILRSKPASEVNDLEIQCAQGLLDDMTEFLSSERGAALADSIDAAEEEISEGRLN